MSEFVSWVEFNGKVLFLDNNRMEGKEQQMKVKYPDKSERQGHAAIRYYYGIKEGDGVDKECTDFSAPTNFPPAIAKAIKTGKMTFCVNNRLYRLLTQPALADYEKIRQPAWNEYEKIRQPAFAEYEKIEQQAWAEYESGKKSEK